MPPSDAELLGLFVRLRKEAFAKLAMPLRDAVLSRYESATSGVKTAADMAAVDKALFLHKAVP